MNVYFTDINTRIKDRIFLSFYQSKNFILYYIVIICVSIPVYICRYTHYTQYFLFLRNKGDTFFGAIQIIMITIRLQGYPFFRQYTLYTRQDDKNTDPQHLKVSTYIPKCNNNYYEPADKYAGALTY